MPEPSLRSAIDNATWSLSAFQEEVTARDHRPLDPFSDVSVSFSSELSRRLFEASGVHSLPDVVSLAYWLRAAPITTLARDFAALSSDDVLLVPRGLVFHVPPANVDTLFVYSWILSLLVGNRNVVRVSEHRGQTVDLILTAIREVFDMPRFSELKVRNWFVHTGHVDEISAALSEVADVRAVWGGDATITHFRRFPLPVRGRELTFADRHSMAVLDAAAVADTPDDALNELAVGFFNDAYWYDQAGCSSPRLILWDAPDLTPVPLARRRFHAAVAVSTAAKGYITEVGTAIEKMVFSFGAAITQRVHSLEMMNNETTWVLLEDLDDYDRRNCGGGLFFEFVTGDLTRTLREFVGPQDQTATYWGLSPELIRRLVAELNGQGVDRWVPVGRALDFDRMWDGYDLLQEFTKRVSIRTGG